MWGGIGFLASYCAKRLGSDRVTTFEANPFMESIIRKAFKLNGVLPKLVICGVGAKNCKREFYIRRNFWASSTAEKRAINATGKIIVQMVSLESQILNLEPSYLIIDIEGGEQELVNCCDLPGVRKIMIELHPELIGEKGVLKLTDWLYSLGFVERAEVSSGVEKYFERGQ